MGSEHYCLRWSNHQSNLLGVFSQLLQDESLVDVTLACSEGASIRAHKVVLSACSSYFQSLFLDHPEKHPIVILKDVRLSELQTLVEFMYKGEVNVQYCQLSALLKTAESLKVKGLAEMTNQNTALREPEREPDRLRSSHSQQQSSTVKSSSGVSIAAPTSSAATAASSSSICDPQCSMETSSSSNLIGSGNTSGSTICGGTSSISQQQQQSISTNSSSVLASISTTNSNFSLTVKRENDRCSPSPPKRLHSSAPSSSPLPLDLYQRRCPSNRSDRHRRIDDEHHDLSTSSMGGGAGGSSSIGGSGGGGISIGVSGRLSRTPTTINDEQLSPAGSCILMGDKEREKDRDRDKHNNNSTDDDDDCGQNSIGINMTINSNSSNNGLQTSGGRDRDRDRDGISNRISSGGNDGIAGHSSSSQTVVVPSLNSLNSQQTSSFHSSDLRPSSRSGGSGISGNVNITHTATSSGISSPIISTEPVAGPSGLGPVQSVPLSLKKEIDWEPEKSGDTVDYRQSHDSETSESPHGVLGGIGSTSTTINAPGGSSGGNGGTSSSLEQSNNPMYPCMYCCATFPHQSKLTRHILSHSLETLKYRETAHLLHSSHIANLMPHDLPPLPQHFSHRHGPPGSSGLIDPMDTSDNTGHSQLDMELHAAAYAAAAAAQSLSGNVNLAGVNSADILMGTSPSSLLAAAAASSQSGLGQSIGGINNSSSSSGMSGNNTITGNTNSSSAAVAAAVAAATAGSSSTSANSDPNNVVLCKFCGKSFPDVASLITHLPVHTGDRPFKCEFCGKAFKLRHHMKDHCRVHTGERPFRCSMCGKTFSRSTILKAHEKTHFPKYVRKFLSTSPVDTKDELPQ